VLSTSDPKKLSRQAVMRQRPLIAVNLLRPSFKPKGLDHALRQEILLDGAE
jgi:hypothetical protein